MSSRLTILQSLGVHHSVRSFVAGAVAWPLVHHVVSLTHLLRLILLLILSSFNLAICSVKLEVGNHIHVLSVTFHG